MNPQGRHLVLGFHGFLESLEEFPQALESTLEEWDIQGIFLDRPGIGPVSTPWPGLNFAAWPQLIEEFDKKALNNQPISIVGHSAGGLYALACAKLACVRALALVCSITPMTFGSLFRTLYHHEVSYDPAEPGVELFPNTLIPVAQQICQRILHDWEAYFKGMVNDLGPTDEVFLTQHETAVHNNMLTSIKQGAEAMVQDVRSFLSPWPLTPADTAHLPILIFNGAGDHIVRPSAGQEIQTHFAPKAHLLPPFAGMGHLPAPEHYARVFTEFGKLLHIQEEKTLARAA